MCRPAIAVLLAALGALGTQAAQAQAPTPQWAPPVGAHVRGFTLKPDSVTINGWITGYHADTARIAACKNCEASTYLPIDSIAALEIERRQSRIVGGHVVSDAFVGLLLGGAAGAGIGWLAYEHEKCRGDMCALAGLAIPYGAAFGAATGFVIGIFVGLGESGAYWQPVHRY